jgi:hypothetical protein
MAENGAPQPAQPAISADGQFAVQVRVEQVGDMIMVILGLSCGPIAQSVYLEPKIANVVAQTIRNAVASAETTIVKPNSPLAEA